jgi:hypothetical protein
MNMTTIFCATSQNEARQIHLADGPGGENDVVELLDHLAGLESAKGAAAPSRGAGAAIPQKEERYQSRDDASVDTSRQSLFIHNLYAQKRYTGKTLCSQPRRAWGEISKAKLTHLCSLARSLN